MIRALDESGFNPRARGGRDLITKCSDLLERCFNPRARGGRDTRCTPGIRYRAVSIHAPAGGATGEQ